MGDIEFEFKGNPWGDLGRNRNKPHSIGTKEGRSQSGNDPMVVCGVIKSLSGDFF